MKYTTLLLSFLCFCTVAFAQEEVKQQDNFETVRGVVYDADTREVMANVQVSSNQALQPSITGAQGRFNIRLATKGTTLSFIREGYFTASEPILGRDSIVIYLQRTDRTMATDRYSIMDGEHMMSDKISPADAINNKDISDNFSKPGDAIAGRFAGLRVLGKSGMPGEGSFLNMRGVRSFYSQNSPLLVIDGAPVRNDQRISNVISGFSSNILETVNLHEVRQITFLKGAEALPYGSLGSNGVIIIETEEGLTNETKVEVKTTQGVSFITRQLPMMNPSQFKNYISDIGSGRYMDPVDFMERFPYLRDNLTSWEALTYGSNTDWQDEIYTPAFSSDNSLQVKGGDAVVKYMLTAGYQVNSGVVDGTESNKFYTRGNTNINFNEKLTANASVAFDYSDIDVFEQGIGVPQSNPLLAAYAYSPLMSTYKYDSYLNLTDSYNEVDPEMGISNPAAIRTETEGAIKKYDMLINAGINYKFAKNFVADVKLGIVYSYAKEDMFIGGRTSNAVAPLMGGVALNTVRSGSTEAKSYYGRVSVGYDNTFNEKHNLSARFGWQLMSYTEEASSGTGINTSSDVYRNLNMNQIAAAGRSSTGYVEIWNWTNAYLTATYNYDNQLYASATAMVDAASTYGDYSDRFFVFPAVQVGWKMNNAPFLRDKADISNLMVRAEYSINPNSRYNSRYGKYYYILQMLQNISGLVRAGVPNRYISPEKVHTLNLGVDFSTYGDRFSVSLDMFQEHTKDMLVETEISPSYGFNTMFKNAGAIRTRGAELSASALILNNSNFRWRVGGNIGHYKSEIKSLGKGVKEQFIELDNGVVLVNRVGETPYAFYGVKANGVFSTEQEAKASGLINYGGYEFQGGDMKFIDQNGDYIISDADRQVLGSADPDFYGGFYSKMSYKNFTLFMNFTFSQGNKIYNAVRRTNESGTSVSNQAESLSRRWVRDGQITDIPRVTFVDAAGNNRFSSRWIEDGSYLKLKEVTLSYDFNREVKIASFLTFTNLKIFVSAENILTFTKYKGSDPEFAYSYDMEMLGMDLAKVPIPKFVKLGFVLNF